MTHPVEGKYVEWPLRAALQDIDERLKRIEVIFADDAMRAGADSSLWDEYERVIARASALR